MSDEQNNYRFRPDQPDHETRITATEESVKIRSHTSHCTGPRNASSTRAYSKPVSKFSLVLVAVIGFALIGGLIFLGYLAFKALLFYIL